MKVCQLFLGSKRGVPWAGENIHRKWRSDVAGGKLISLAFSQVTLQTDMKMHFKEHNYCSFFSDKSSLEINQLPWINPIKEKERETPSQEKAQILFCRTWEFTFFFFTWGNNSFSIVKAILQSTFPPFLKLVQ